MTKITKTAQGLSNELAPVLEGCLDAVYKVTDRHKARQIDQQFKQIIKLSIAAAEAGISPEQFMALLSVFNTQTAIVSGGRLEFAAAVASGMETAEGKAFHVSMSVGGAIGGFGIEAEGGYQSDSRSSAYERSSQNLRIRLDWATVPAEQVEAFAEAMAARIFESGFTPSEPSILEGERSPVLEALESYIPVIKEIFAPKIEDDQD